MIAIDTNVVVRFLVNDDRAQAAAARKLIAREPVWISRTVLLETEWVLRGAYELERVAIATALRAFAGIPTVTVENPAVIAQALDGFDQGMDFADALHLGAAEAAGCAGLTSFDRKFAAAVRKARAGEVTLLKR